MMPNNLRHLFRQRSSNLINICGIRYQQSTEQSSREDSAEVHEYMEGKEMCPRCQQLDEPLICEHCSDLFCKTCLINALLIYQQPRSLCVTSLRYRPEPEDIHKFKCRYVGCSAIIPLSSIGKHDRQCLYKIPPQKNQ